MARPDSSRDGKSIVQLLRLAASKADKVFATRGASIAVTAREYEVLAAVARTDGLSQTDIMADAGIDRTSTAALVGRLVRRSLLHRRRDKTDRRAYRVRLTDRGRAVLATAEPVSRSIETTLLQRLSPLQKSQLTEALEHIVAE